MLRSFWAEICQEALEIPRKDEDVRPGRNATSGGVGRMGKEFSALDGTKMLDGNAA
jgi:hypothetical protein